MTWRRLALCAFLLLLIAGPYLLPSYQVTLLNYVGLASLVALGLVLLTGIGGLTSFGQAAFVGIGAYTTAYLTTAFGVSPWLTLLAGIVLAGLVAALIGAVTLKLSGHYLALSTIAWSLSLFFLVGVLPALGAHDGLTGVPPVAIGSFAFREAWQSYYLIWAFVLLGLLSVHNLLTSRSGRAIRCLRGRSLMAEAFGVDTVALKTVIFVHAAILASVSGWLYAHLLLFVNPTPFGLNYGIEYLFMAVVGGAGSIWGAVVGAGLLTILRDRLQDLVPNFGGGGGAIETVAFGVLMVLVLQRARTGLVPFITKVLPPALPIRLAAGAPVLASRETYKAPGPLLAVRGITRRFGGLIAVNDVSFEIGRGEILAVIGPNGAGKSTLFNLVTGVLHIDQGEIRFCDRRIDAMPSRAIARLGMARTFQHVQLRSDMSALENVAIGAHLRSRKGVFSSIFRLDRSDERALLAEAARQITRVGLATHMQAPAGSLALGQQRILEIARALAADPQLLLLDEPAAGLRHHEKQALAAVLKQLRGEGISILIVEHDMDFVMNLVDRLVVMDFGQKIAAGLPGEIQNDRAVQEAYLGAAGMSALLEVRDLHVAYGKVEALTGISLSVEAGAIVTVIGPNGAGKTTLLNAIIGLLPSRGSLTYQGHSLAQRAVEDRVGDGLCLVPEKRELFSQMSVADNLELGGYTQRHSDARKRNDLLESLYARFPRLRERRTQLAGTLSGGERQMLAIARALMARPKLLMLDEPSLGLAPLIVREVFEIVKTLRDEGVSILVIEQNANAALQIADYGYVLETGAIVLEGPAQALARNARVAETYLGFGKAAQPVTA